jgi:hypothetical protein
MTNSLYGPAAKGILTGLIDVDTAVLKCAFVRGYTHATTHEFVSDVTGAGGTLNGTSAALAGVTVSATGVLDADDTTITTTASASDHVLILFQASAVTGGADVAASSQRLIAYYDTGTNLPVQPGTGATPVTWSSGASKILKVS